MTHVPVLLKEVLQFLKPKSGESFIDATVGNAGHAKAILERTAPDGRLLGIDLSKDALKRVNTIFAPYKNRVILKQGNFKDIKKIAYGSSVDQFDGILIDLGVSSEELGDASLGLSFQIDGPLDMRLSGEGETAAEIINSYKAEDLAQLIRKYGEERYANRIAKAVVAARKRDRILTTSVLKNIITDAVPANYERNRIHPATRTFQALRIAVNHELENLEAVLPQAVELLGKGGRLVVISFHSLEDRIVKRFFREHRGKELEVLTKRPIQAGEEEIAKNPRARSAKLRAVKRL